MKTEIRHVAVLVPARDEERLLPRCLRSVLVACAALPPEISFDVIVAADRSTDGTRALAEVMLRGRGAVLSVDAGVVGHARASAAELAMKRYAGPPELCWLANTDADCEVPENWLLYQVTCAEAGAHAIAGVVDVDTFAEHRVGVDELFRASYLLHPDGTHPHVHGANIGVRADIYLRAGGWSNLETAEDHDLWNRLSSLECRKLSHSQLTVITSGRRVGRAPQGFAGALAAHNEALA